MPVSFSSDHPSVSDSDIRNATNNLINKSASLRRAIDALEKQGVQIDIKVTDNPDAEGAEITEIGNDDSHFEIKIPKQVFDGEKYFDHNNQEHNVTYERNLAHELVHVYKDVFNKTDSEEIAENGADKIMKEAYQEKGNQYDSNPPDSTPGTPNFHDTSPPEPNDYEWPGQPIYTPPAGLQPIGFVPTQSGGSGVGMGGGLDPLVFDLDGSGTIDLISVQNSGIHFDFWGDGFSEATGWVAAVDGMLAWDIDESGFIDNVAELFGSNFPISYVTEADWVQFRDFENGFARLAALDSNLDGEINSNDTIWTELRIWQDVNQDGVSQNSELLTLSQAGISSIDITNYVLDSFQGLSSGGFTRIIEGNTVTHTGSFELVGGGTRELVDVWFDTNMDNTVYSSEYIFEGDVLFLPMLRGYGQIADLYVAMSVDNQAEGLFGLVQNFFVARTFSDIFVDFSSVRDEVEEIILRWGGIDSFSFEEQKYGVFGLMQEFLFIKKLSGTDSDYQGVWFDGTPYLPHTVDGIEAIHDTWSGLIDAYTVRLAFQSGAEALFENVVAYDPDRDVFNGDLSLSQTAIAALETAATGHADIQGFWNFVASFINEVKGISQLTTNEVTWLSDAVVDSSSGALSWGGIVATLSQQTITGSSGNETLNGTRWDDNMDALAGNNIVSGGEGNDSLKSGSGVDTLNGGAGNDILRGGSGNDVYIYDSGHDVIAEDFGNYTTSTDTIQFGAGIAVSDVSLHIAQMVANVSTWHIFLEIAGRGTITIDTPSGGNGPLTQLVDTLVFADTTTFNISTMDVTFHGQAGDDYINTANWVTTGDQFAYGYGGDDRIDLIGTQPIQVDGGDGRDLIYGSVYNDTFVISPGGDQIVGGGGSNTIMLPVGFTAADVTYFRYEDSTTPYSSPKTWDAMITVAGLGSITVLRQFEGDADSIIQTLKFSDGSTVNLLTQEYVTFGTSGDDTYDNVGSLWANKNDVYLFGQGDDIVQEDAGTDTILFAAGLNLSNITVQKRDTGSHFTTTKHLVIEDSNGNTLTFQQHFNNNAYKAENLRFSDGSVISLTSLEIDSHGSSGNDRLDGIVAGLDLTTNDVMYGHGGADQIYAGAGNDVSYGGDGDDYIFDDAGNDMLYGEDGIDQLYGYTGDDSLYGGAGNDTLRGDDTFASSSVTGNDTLFGGDGNDNLSGGRGNDTLDGGAGDDVINGDNDTDTVTYASATLAVTVSLALTTAQNTLGAGTDTVTNIENLTGSAFGDSLTGDANANALTGNDGNDVLEGGAGNDTLTGGNGLDTASYASATAAVTVNLATTTAQNTVGAGTDTLVSIENARGSAFNDTLTGSSAANLIEGGAGDDTLNGAAGTDTLSYALAASAVTVNLATTTSQATGGAGSDTVSNFENLTGSAFNDTLTGNTGNNVIEGGAGNDAINGSTGTDTASYENATAAVTVSLAVTTAQNTIGAGTDTLTAMEHLRGSAFNDTLTGSSTDNTIEGGAGDDIMNAGSGSDTLLYANAASGITVSLAITTAQNTGGAGTDTVTNFERITGSAYADILTGSSAANTLDGGLGDDILDGGAGNDTLNGNIGIDTASYASATSAVTVNLSLSAAQNTVGAGTDTLQAVENVTGSGFNDTLTGSTAINVMIGGAGNDTLRGGAANDTLKGGLGADTLYGEADADTFVFEAASAFTAQDTVADFSTAQGDKLNIADLLIGYTAGQSAIDDFVTFTTAGANTNFAVDRDGAGTTYSAVTIASLTGVTGLDADTLLTNGNLIAV